MTFFILSMWYSLFYTNIDCRNKNCPCLTSTHWKRRSDAFLWIHFRGVFHQFGGLAVLERHLSREFMYIILLGSIQMWQSDLSGGWVRGSSHIYSSGDFPWLIYNESAFLSSNTIRGDWFPFYRSIIILPEIGKKKDSLENTTALQTLERTGELCVVRKLAAEKWWEL